MMGGGKGAWLVGRGKVKSGPRGRHAKDGDQFQSRHSSQRPASMQQDAGIGATASSSRKHEWGGVGGCMRTWLGELLADG